MSFQLLRAGTESKKDQSLVVPTRKSIPLSLKGKKKNSNAVISSTRLQSAEHHFSGQVMKKSSTLGLGIPFPVNSTNLTISSLPKANYIKFQHNVVSESPEDKAPLASYSSSLVWEPTICRTSADVKFLLSLLFNRSAFSSTRNGRTQMLHKRRKINTHCSILSFF